MKRLKICSFILGVICLAISTVVIFNDSKKDNIYNLNNSENIETINTQRKVGVNTKIKIITHYALCGHEIITNVDVTKDMMNLSYDELKNRYRGYEFINLDDDNIILKRNINDYCNEHFLVKIEDEKICIYVIHSDNTQEFISLLDIPIDTLRQNDRYMLKTTGITIFGKESLYKFLEDFDS